jgi:hypothetical protein
VQTAAELADRLLGSEQGLRRHAAERQHDLRLDHGELRGEERRARRQLVRLGIAIGGRAALDGVGDEAVALAVELHGLEHPGEELAGAAHEGLALRVLVGAGALADADEIGARVAGAEDDGLPAVAELAASAALEIPLLGGEGLLGREQIRAAQADLDEAEVAVVAERRAERGERLGQRRVGPGAQREPFPEGAADGAAARSATM